VVVHWWPLRLGTSRAPVLAAEICKAGVVWLVVSFSARPDQLIRKAIQIKD
jgi:hypothetical protein